LRQRDMDDAVAKLSTETGPAHPPTPTANTLAAPIGRGSRWHPVGGPRQRLAHSWCQATRSRHQSLTLCDRLSHHRLVANIVRLQRHGLPYRLASLLRASVLRGR
jgi:cell division inhibitor SulA